MDDEFNPILLIGNLTRSGQVMYDIFLGSKESLFGVYFRYGFVPINEYRFRPRGV